MDIKLPIANEIVVPKPVQAVVSQGAFKLVPKATLDDVFLDINPTKVTESGLGDKNTTVNQGVLCAKLLMAQPCLRIYPR